MTKFILCDIDGTIADSRHRSKFLPSYPDTPVTRVKVFYDDGIEPGTLGRVVGSREVEHSEEAVVTIAWRDYGDGEITKEYPWSAFMEVTNSSWKPWHAPILADTPISHNIYILQAMRPQLLRDGHAVLFLTSRHESSRFDTLHWLIREGATAERFGDILEMRPEGDPRKDCVYKGEVLDRYVNAGHSFLFALEDRKKVADFLRARGIPTLHVADYD